MNFKKSKEYVRDLVYALNSIKSIEIMKNQSVCVTGATGLIGSFIVDMLIEYNKVSDADITVYAMSRSMEHLHQRFGEEKHDLVFLQHDVCGPLNGDWVFNYIIHAASNAYPKVIVNDPVGTILANVIGTKELLEYGKKHGMNKFLYVSSGEVYGKNDSEIPIKEECNGYIDTLDARSCYPISKRAAENLCVSYAKQYGMNISIVRPSHTYGPNALADDNRANVQFINNILNGEDIVLKSSGSQIRSYTYVADCASAVLYVLLHGKDCEAYNISNPNSVSSIADFAGTLAEIGQKGVKFAEADREERKQMSPFHNQVLCADKLEQLGWTGSFDIETGIQRTLLILEEIKGIEHVI